MRSAGFCEANCSDEVHCVGEEWFSPTLIGSHAFSPPKLAATGRTHSTQELTPRTSVNSSNGIPVKQEVH